MEIYIINIGEVEINENKWQILGNDNYKSGTLLTSND